MPMSRSSPWALVVERACAYATSARVLLLLERGGHLPRKRDNWDADSVLSAYRHQTDEQWSDSGGRRFTPVTRHRVSSNTRIDGAANLRPRAANVTIRHHLDTDAPRGRSAATTSRHITRGLWPGRSLIDRPATIRPGHPAPWFLFADGA
jgi:hypothetical protein